MRKLTVIVGGLIVESASAGLAWHYLNYIHGLLELGHDVWFLEELNFPAYDPVSRQDCPAGIFGRRFLEDALRACERPVPYCYHSELGDLWYGLGREGLHDLLRRADLMICVSAVTPIRDERPRPRKVLAIDTDPVYTQLRMNSDRQFLEYYKKCDAVATFGKLIGTEKCALPTHGFQWIATQQPVSLRQWEFAEAKPSQVFTTVTGWRHLDWQHPDEIRYQFEGLTYRRAKDVEWLAVMDLPRRVPWWMTMAVDTKTVEMPLSAQHALRDRGWFLLDPVERALTPVLYKQFIASAAGEFTVAKQQYVGVPSGWFSDRSACFLATGRPVVTQETGFSDWLPAGEGLFGFLTTDEAASALCEIRREYDRHARAARRIAEEHFDAKKVLSDLLERVL